MDIINELIYISWMIVKKIFILLLEIIEGKFVITTLIVIFTAFVLYKLYKKFKNKIRFLSKISQTKSNQNNISGSPDIKKAQNIEISPEQKEELSWEFLNYVTEIVLFKFSKEDQELLKTIGKNLYDSDVRYEHVIKLGLDHKKMESLKKNNVDEKK